MSKFYETLKAIFCDIESFLTATLKDVKLSKAAVAERESILKKLSALQDDFPQLKTIAEPPPPQLPAKSADLPELRKKPNNPVPECSDDPHEVYSALDEEPGQEVDSSKASDTISDVSEVAPVFISVSDAMANCSHSGLLVKKNVSKSIKSLLVRGKKFCVVSGGVFYMFDKANSKKQCGSFLLRGYEARTSADQQSKKEFTFELVNPGQKTYAFAAGSAEEMQEWINVLTAEALKNPDPRTSVHFDLNAASSDLEDYEEPEESPPAPAAAKNNKQPAKAAAVKLPALPSRPPQVDADDELYDDVQVAATPADGGGCGEEVYDDAAANEAIESDDLIYECFDDVNEPMPLEKAASPAAPQAASRAAALIETLRPPSSDARRSTPSSSVAAGTGGGDTDYENMFYGKWSCCADADNELSFRAGDVISVVGREYDNFGWWVGKLNGKVGLVPREYLTPAYEPVPGSLA